ncbi:MAG: DEAD/DEAH box helicase [Deltaproteobacteria bacterium]|nr:DEAD/DEAH box helicase [Deltaproteobacteria bacterium]NMD39598.1 DEAD/DEAH box helicase [Deltaproteobacteria bacterium]
MIKTLANKGFSEPTPIQQAVIPFILEGDRDVVAQAETGTGKTAAFAIPMIERMDSPDGHVKALVLVPTRELAIQVADETRSLRGRKKIEVVSIYGGQPFGPQRSALKHGADIVVGTTGRILDHLEKGTLRLDGLTHLVLDEADEMLDMGFIDDIRAILGHAPADRRTMLFSATMPREVVAIAKRHMGRYETITTGTQKQSSRLTEQIFLEVREKDRFDALCRIIDMEPEFYGLVFCRTRVETADLADRLIERGYGAECIHGEIDQSERERIMKRLRTKQTTILVATDVAARGIDISCLTHVINYDPPQDPDAYVHRIGRTGRAGQKGIAVTLVTPKEQRALDLIRRTTGKDLRRGSIPGVKDIIASKRARIEAEIQRIIKEEDSGAYALLAAELLEGSDPAAVLAACLRHAYGNELDPKMYREIRAVAPQVETASKTRLFVARGRRHGMTPQNLLRFIREHTGVKERLVSNIEIRDDFTFISVPRAEAMVIQKRLGRKNGRPLATEARPEQDRRMAG